MIENQATSTELTQLKSITLVKVVIAITLITERSIGVNNYGYTEEPAI